MPDGLTGSFVPLRLNFDIAQESGRFYIYSIWNRKKDKYYIGISRNPSRRINDQLRSKAELCKDYAEEAFNDQTRPPEERVFEFGILNLEGFESPLIGCIAEVLYMVNLEKTGKAIYNRNKFGGHPELQSKRVAFETVVKIIDPSLQGHPSDQEMRELEKHIPEIRDFALKKNFEGVFDYEFMAELEKAWDDYIERRKQAGFGRKPLTTIIAFDDEYLKLTPVNDNSPNGPKPASRNTSLVAAGTKQYKYEDASLVAIDRDEPEPF